MTDFFQDPPRLTNQYDDDPLLASYLRWRLPPEMFGEVEPALRHLGERAATDLLALDTAAEASPPKHVPFDPWGRRVDNIETSDAWRALDRIAAEEGLVAIGYERSHAAHSRVDQFARLYLYSPSSATYSCPLAMTDGAARLLELYPDDVTRSVFEHLISRDPEYFWTSGQWMTERTGGSDVSGTSTIARLGADSPSIDYRYRLYGTKWFTSATTSQIAVTLAYIEGEKSLSVFLVRLRDDDGALRNMRVNRLKDKLGTRALPTAELTLDGTPAHLIGDKGDGVRKIASMFNVTRVYNAVAAVAGMRRAIALARDYASRRIAFRKRLLDHPLHAETLAAMELEWRAGFLLAFHVVELLGIQEAGTATEDDLSRLRLLIPIAKLYTAKQAVAVASEALECFGGAGYIEDTGIPRLLRDAQVLSIWEGTTNVLSLDVLRALEKTNALDAFLGDARERLSAIRNESLSVSVTRVRDALRSIASFGERAADEGRGYAEARARSFAYALARTTAAVQLLEFAEWSRASGTDDQPAVIAATRWCSGDLTLEKAEGPVPSPMSIG
ncbi:MAG TPA: acyl-CoA dehydrogenase family protein [Gemmatimonadaceae bacterium]|nr:acyl-CoA dehydrogenase family protein [Gemmatimonadaceae bacterium]